MKKIKFRGKSKYSGKIVYGDLNCGQENMYVDDEPAYPESVAQFVGYDKNGKEIYSDDEIRVYDHSRYCMAGTGIEIAGDFIKINDIGKTFDNVEVLGE